MSSHAVHDAASLHTSFVLLFPLSVMVDRKVSFRHAARAILTNPSASESRTDRGFAGKSAPVAN